MMKTFYAAIGLAGALLTGTAHATVVYDTITGQTENTSGTRDSLRSVAAANRGPIGDAYTASYDQLLTNITVRLRNVNTTAVGDTGSVLLFLVPSTGVGALNVPSAVSGTNLSGSKILLGQIADTAVPFAGTAIPAPSAFANISVNTSVLLNGGTTYWFEMVDAADPVNGIGQPVSSFLKWGLNSDVTGTGVPSGSNSIISFTNATANGFVSYNAANNPNTGAGEVFEMQLDAVPAPEPASLGLLGVGLAALGFSRRRSNKKAAA